MGYYVSRQNYWPSGEYGVEIVGPSFEDASPGQLVEKYTAEGEGQEYASPVDAVAAAIRVLRAWRKDTKQRIRLYGYSTGGGMWGTEEVTPAEALKWATTREANMPKCEGCSKPMGERTYWANDWDGLEYCSRQCAQRAYDWEQEQARELEEEEVEY